MFEDERFLNEPKLDDADENLGPDDYAYYDHIYTTDHDETYKIIYDWRDFVDKYSEEKEGDPRILMAESYAPIDQVMRYYEDTVDDVVRVGAHFPFNFELLGGLNEDATADSIVAIVKNWMNKMPNGHTANWVVSF